MVARRDPYESPAIRAFAAELEVWRRMAGLPKTELAEALGYTPQLIGQLEAGKNIPSKKFTEDTDTYFDTNGVFAAMAILAVIALGAEFLITTLENRLITWRPGRRDEVSL